MKEQEEVQLWEKVRTAADDGFDLWCQENNSSGIGLPIRGRLYAALIVLSNLEAKTWQFVDLSEAISTDEGKFFGRRALRNHGASRILRVFQQHLRTDLAPNGISGEQGRTSGGTKEAGLQFIRLIRNTLEQVPVEIWDEQGNALVSYLYSRVFALLQKYQELGGIDVSFSSSESISAYISKLLDAHKTNPGAVLQHLIGAKLEIRFSGQFVPIAHNSSAAADVQTGRRGDFEIGSTVFHVTKRANDGHYRKAKQNADNGRKVYLLVPDNVLRAVKDYAEQFEKGFSKKVDIFSIEQFVAQNLDELAVFDKSEALRNLKHLLEKYNELIDAFENEVSLKIIISDFGIE